MTTESIDPRYAELDRWPLAAAVHAMWEGQLAALAALGPALDAITDAAEAAAQRLGGGGRLIYAGAGTSGRLALLDGVELRPTFDWPAQRLVCLLAGGTRAVSESVEGAEDDSAAAEAAIAEAHVDEADVVIAVAASGKTPFTCSALTAGRKRGALGIAIANNANAPLLALADHAILLQTGAEVLAGSTRMKAGTAQKATLNLLSTATMQALGRTYAGRMVSMRTSNAKLQARAREMVADLASVEGTVAQVALERAQGDIRAAILVARGLEPQAAHDLLASHAGHLRAALEEIDAG